MITAIQRLEKLRKEETEGLRPVFRPRGYMEEERRMAKLKKMRSWHSSSSKAGAPLIICPGAGGSLTNKLKDICKKFEKEHNIEVRVFERGGNKIERLVRSDPLKNETCGREDCFPCVSGGGGDCSRSCSAYRVDCQECLSQNIKAIYVGETGRNGYARGLEHEDGLEKQKDDNPLWKHCLIQHGGRQVKFKMTCLQSFKTAFLRQVNEGVRIACCGADICLNSKMQFHQPAIVRTTATLGNTNDEQIFHNSQSGGRNDNAGQPTSRTSSRGSSGGGRIWAGRGTGQARG